MKHKKKRKTDRDLGTFLLGFMIALLGVIIVVLNGEVSLWEDLGVVMVFGGGLLIGRVTI